MGQGIRGLHPCGCDTNLVWGTLTHDWFFPGLSPADTRRFTGAIRVRAKVSPYGSDYKGTARGQLPSWTEGTSVQFRQSVTPHQYAGDEEMQWYGLYTPWGSRAVYIDGKQTYVNYLIGGGNHATDYECSVTDLCQVTIDGMTVDEKFLGYTGDWPPPASLRPPYRYPLYDAAGVKTPADSTGLFPPELYYKRPRPRAWYAGQRYLVFTGYATSDYNAIGGNEWYVTRYDREGATDADPNAAWYLPTLPPVGGFLTIRDYIMRPSFRCYINSNDPQPDEPWVMAYDEITRRFTTGRWRGQNGLSLTNEVENVVVPNAEAAGMGFEPNLVYYLRAQGRDLAIFRGSMDRVLTNPSGAYWLYDGESLTALGEQPTFLTLDHEGNIIYGNSRFLRKLGPNGWHISATGQGVHPVAGFWYEPPDDPDWTRDPNGTTFPDWYREKSELFQIVANKDWIQVRGWAGAPDMATVPLEHADWGDYQVADTANSRLGPGLAGQVIPCWSISHDGSVLIPHVQPVSPYPRYNSFLGAGYQYPEDPTRRVIARTYVDRDCCEWQVIDPGANEFAWPKYRAALPANDVAGMVNYIPNAAGHGSLGFVKADAMLAASDLYDFDIVDEKCCGCAATGSPAY